MEHVDTAPLEQVEEQTYQETEPLYEVSKTTRFLHYVIDFAGFYAFAFLSGIVLYLMGFENLIESMNEYVLGIIIMITYYWLLETAFGQTLGKLITGSVVVTEDGGKPTILHIFKRTLSRFVPFEVLTFLGSGPGLHDRLSGTRVVKKIKK